MKNKISPRKLALLIIPFIHSALIFAPYCCMITALTQPKLYLEGVTLAVSYIIIVPSAVISILTVKIKNMWLYILLSLTVCAVMFFATGMWSMAVFTVFYTVIKASARLNGSRTIFDAPHWAGAAAFIVPFVFSAYVKNPAFQLVTVCSLVVYLSITLLYRGLLRTDKYITINNNMYNFPSARIGKTSGRIFTAVCIVILMVAIPVVITNFSMYEISDPPKRTAVEEAPQDKTSAGTIQIPEWMKAAEGTEPWIDLAFLANILMYLCIALAAFLIIYGIYKLTGNFNNSVMEKNDVIETIHNEDSYDVINNRLHRLKLFDFSPNSFVRKKYIKKVNSCKNILPKEWQSPTEIENSAETDFGILHDLYEKARYSKDGCQKSDLERLKR